jgi:hypothetical protein
MYSIFLFDLLMPHPQNVISFAVTNRIFSDSFHRAKLLSGDARDEPLYLKQMFQLLEVLSYIWEHINSFIS